MSMKLYKTNLLFILIILFISLFFSCNDGTKSSYTYTKYNPVYLSYNELRSSVFKTDPTPLKKTGKIYMKDNYIFINELYKGVHVIDNSTPSNPQNIAFINIPGNIDIAIMNNILYADSYVDLVAIDISNINSISVVKRLENVFPYMYYSYDWNWSVGYYSYSYDSSKGILIGWEPEKVTVYFDESTYGEDYVTPVTQNTGTNNVGTAGSMARFAIYNNYLYCIDKSDLQIVNISTPASPSLWGRTTIGWNIETLFPYNNYLFIGSMTGMYIYNLTDPANPAYTSQFSHITSCDPVVVQGNYAYVTLRSGSRCNTTGYSNELEIINVSNLTSPTSVKAYLMQGPYGLAIDGSSLFVCDGAAGLKVFNAADPLNLSLLTQISSFNTYDIILYQSRAHVIGNDGLYQYDYSNPLSIQFISSIPVIETSSSDVTYVNRW